MVEELTQENFDQKMAAGNVVIDFWAPWCGPCKIMAPEFEAAAEESDATFYKLNAEDCPDVPPKYNIRGIPTVIFFKNGEEVGRFSGARKKEEILEEVNKAFA